MAILTIPNSCKWQPNDEANVESSGTTYVRTLKGPLTDLATVNADVVLGETEIVSGIVASAKRLVRTNGNVGTLAFNCVPKPTDESGNNKPISDVWGVKSTRIDMPIEVYCGESVANPNRVHIAMWRAESDPDLADGNQFKTADGVIRDLTDASVALADKIRRGIDSVMRFYPTVTRKRVWANCPNSIGANLSFINTPSGCQEQGISALFNSYQWLKIQDDVEQQSDGTWAQVEAWIGATAWDSNLYGGTSDRWAMPAFPT